MVGRRRCSVAGGGGGGRIGGVIRCLSGDAEQVGGHEALLLKLLLEHHLHLGHARAKIVLEGKRKNLYKYVYTAKMVRSIQYH